MIAIEVTTQQSLVCPATYMYICRFDWCRVDSVKILNLPSNTALIGTEITCSSTILSVLVNLQCLKTSILILFQIPLKLLLGHSLF